MRQCEHDDAFCLRAIDQGKWKTLYEHSTSLGCGSRTSQWEGQRAKKRFLDASKAIAALKGNPTEDGLAREWKNVESAWKDVLKERKKR